MQLTIQPMTRSGVMAIASWRYPPPYDIYNLTFPPSAADVQYFLDPAIAYHEIRDGAGELVGFCSFGADGQVPGGDYRTAALDIGMGIHPDLTGQGLGHSFGQAVIDFACSHCAPAQLRVTIANFNLRAQRVWQRLGFQPVTSFAARVGDGLPFTIFTRAF